MEGVGKLLVIKCWLEVDTFVVAVTKYNKLKTYETHTKMNRTQSFDVTCIENDKENIKIHRRHSYKLDNEENNIHIRKINTSTQASNLPHTYNSDDINCTDYKNQNIPNITEEAINLFKKYVALEATCKLDVPDNVRKLIISNICHPEGLIHEDCFKPLQDMVFHQMETTDFEEFQKSPLYIKAQIDILTNSSLTLSDILNNDSILFFFTEYLEQESCSVLLEFLIAIMHFRDNLQSDMAPDPSQAQADAIILYEKYFSLQATSPVGFSTAVRLKVEGDICREEGPLYDCFDLPYQIVYKTVAHYVKTFFDSELYFKYLSEMINSVDHLWQSHKKPQSDCSSEVSISTQNTLLAMGDPSFQKKRRNHSVPDMTIDSNQLYNADSLWQRKRQEGLNLGRVNSLGRFESKFEPDPEKKRKSMFKKMVNRFVPTNSSEVEEEMAWQVAHMIVKDITDLTMAPPDNVT